MKSAQDLERVSWMMRREVLQMVYQAGAGHLASSLGLAELFAVMYLGGLLQYDSQEPEWEGRDRLIVSSGHVAPIWYTALAYAGYFPKEKLMTYMKLGSQLQGHPHVWMEYEEKMKRIGLPGIESVSGSLGQGVSIAVGMALAIKLRKNELQLEYGRLPRVFCLMSDAELQEGQSWEAFQMAVQQNLSHLTFVIDRNNIQIDTEVDDINPIEPLEAKLESFGMYVLEANGHDVESLRARFFEDLSVPAQPVALIIHTIPGRGVGFMENDYEWHDKVPDERQLKQALREIEKRL